MLQHSSSHHLGSCTRATPHARQMRVHARWRLWAAVWAVAWFWPGAVAMRCSHSYMCSLGKLSPFIGEISDSQGLKTAAATRSYNNELILVLTFPNRILDVKLLIGNLAKLGMEHMLLMGHNRTTCDVVAQQLPHIGCAWDNYKLPKLPELYAAWHLRYRTLARLVRMGYNVLLADSDIILFDDPYRFFKAPPFNSFTIINQAEILFSTGVYEKAYLANGGLLYVQNARRDGVAAWLLAEVCDRYLRWDDDNFNLTRHKGVAREANTMDQSALNDALSSVATGFPHFLHTMLMFARDVPSLSKHQRFVQGQFESSWQTTLMPVPKFMQLLAGGANTTLRFLDMIMPHTTGTWPEKFGGRWYPEGRGPLSKGFLELLKADCGGCPLWPDIEDPSTLQAVQAIPRERYLLAPTWLMCGYNACGATGSWLPAASGKVHQVVGHAHYMPEANVVSKLMYRMLVDEYDWAAAEAHWGSPHVFQANMKQEEAAGDTPFIEDQPSVPKLLVVSSRVRIHRLQRLDEYLQLVRGAMQLAHLSNRTLVWPDVPCAAPWVGTINATTQLFTPHLDSVWYPYGTRAGATMQCMLAHLIRPECVVHRRGMSGVEFEYFQQRYGARYDFEPGRGNTAFFPVASEVHSTLDTLTGGPMSVMVEVTDQDAQQHLDSLSNAQVVYLAHPVQVASYPMPDWTGCLDRATVQRYMRQTFMPMHVRNVTNRVIPGRIVSDRLTSIGGLAPRNPTLDVRLSNQIRGPSRFRGSATWVKP